jgi:hypothetical protein
MYFGSWAELMSKFFRANKLRFLNQAEMCAVGIMKHPYFAGRSTDQIQNWCRVRPPMPRELLFKNDPIYAHSTPDAHLKVARILQPSLF